MENKITILSDRKHIELDTDRILYILMVGKMQNFICCMAKYIIREVQFYRLRNS